tara:strand:- start:67774 stop:68175 length:402 start_codon:yes stop_codon:yes gene_type:complete
MEIIMSNKEDKNYEESIGKLIADKNRHKEEHLRVEQGNLQLDDNTPKTTVLKGRNSKPRGSKPAKQNLDNTRQYNIKPDSADDDYGQSVIDSTRKEIEENKIKEQKKKDLDKKKKREEKINRINRRANLLKRK